MPLIETAATIDSACISTAPVFEKRSSTGRKTKDGAPKETDQGWWALFVHNKNGARPEGGLVQTLLWSVWLVAFASTWFIPDDRFYHFLGAVCGLVLLGALIPDDGSTVLPYYLHVILPIMAFKSAISSATFGGHWSFSLFYFVFGVIPLADYIIGVDVANQTREEQKQLHGAFRFKLHTLLVPVCILAMIVAGSFFVQCLGWEGGVEGGGGREGAGLLLEAMSDQCSAVAALRPKLSLLEFVGFGVSAGFYSGAIGIVVGHELCHKVRSERVMVSRLSSPPPPDDF